MASDSSDDEVEQYLYKIIVMGDGAVGKTSLINRFCQDDFRQSYKQTIGVDFFNKKIVLPGNVHVTLQIWDIGGQQIGGKMLSKYIFGAHAIMLAYDVTNADSFKNLEDWLEFVRRETKPGEKPPYLALVGNKMDLQYMRQVKPERHTLFAADAQMTPFFVSAKTGEKVNSTFYRVAGDLAGVSFSKADMEVTDNAITAPVVEHPKAPQPAGRLGPEPTPQSSSCIVQ